MTAIDWESRWIMGGWREDLRLLRKKFPIAPRNTWSSVAYALAAVYLVAIGEGATRWVVGAGMVVLAIGSAGYHCWKTEPWRNWDWAGMGGTMTPLAVNGVLHASQGLALGALSVGIPAAALIAWGGTKHSDLVMGLLFVGSSVPAFLAGNTWPAIEAVALFALAMAFWYADRKAWAIVGLWGHAIWHILTAAAMPQLYQAQG